MLMPCLRAGWRAIQIQTRPWIWCGSTSLFSPTPGWSALGRARSSRSGLALACGRYLAGAERTFRSALQLMDRDPELHFAHSTPAFYALMERYRPDLFARIQDASRQGRWEPINGPWVETDCVLVSAASLWRQFQLGQEASRRQFPEWRHDLAWLLTASVSGRFASGGSGNGVRWFCTHSWPGMPAIPSPIVCSVAQPRRWAGAGADAARDRHRCRPRGHAAGTALFRAGHRRGSGVVAPWCG